MKKQIAILTTILPLVIACAPERDFGEESSKNFPPVISAHVPESYLVDEELTIDASGSLDADGTIVHYFARFGDGSPEVESHDGIFMHTYKNTGKFTISIEVIDDLEEAAERRYEISILSVKPPDCNDEAIKCRPGRECREDGYCYTTD